MSPRARTALIVAALAAFAAVAVVGAAVLTADEREADSAATVPPKPRKGAPPLELSFGVRDDAEARRAPTRTAVLRLRPPRAGADDLRPLRLARGEARRGLRGLARDRGSGRAARRALPSQRTRPAPRRAGAPLGGHRRCGRRLARGARRRAGHAVRGLGRRPPPPRAGARPAGLHAELPLPGARRHACGTARGATGRPQPGGPADLRDRAAATRPAGLRASRLRGSAAAWRRTTSTRWSPTQSGGTRRAIWPVPSAASARSRAGFPSRRACAFTSASSSSGRAT